MEIYKQACSNAEGYNLKFNLIIEDIIRETHDLIQRNNDIKEKILTASRRGETATWIDFNLIPEEMCNDISIKKINETLLNLRKDGEFKLEIKKILGAMTMCIRWD